MKDENGKYTWKKFSKEEYNKLGDFNSRQMQKARYQAEGGLTGMAWNKIKSAKNATTKFVKDWTWDSKAGKWVRNTGSNIKNAAVTKLKDAGKWMKDAGKTVLHGDRYISGLDGELRRFTNVPGNVSVLAKNDSRARIKWGEVGGLKGLVTEEIPNSVKNKYESLKKSIKKFHTEAGKSLGIIKDTFSDLGNGLGEDVKKFAADLNITKQLKDAGNQLRSGAENMYKKAMNIGLGDGVKVGDMVEGAKETGNMVSHAATTIKNKVVSFGETAVNKVKNAAEGDFAQKALEKAKGAKEGLYDFFMKNCAGALDVLKSNETVKKLMGADVSKLITSLGSQIKKCTPEIFKSIAEKVAEAVTKTVGFASTAGGAQLLFSLYDAYSGAVDAAEMWQVKPEDVTVGMRTACIILNVIMGLGPMIWVDLALEAVYLGTSFVMGEENAINVKQIILGLIYDCLPNAYDKEKIKELQNKQRSEYDEYVKSEYEKYKAAAESSGKEVLSQEDWAKSDQANIDGYDTWIHKKNEDNHPILDAARKTSLGRWLFGANDENGNFQQGAFANARDWLFGNDEKKIESAFSRAGKWLFGSDELDENGQPINKGVINEFIDTVSGFIDGVVDLFKQTKRFIFDMSMDERLTTIWKLFVGGEDEKGEYKIGIFPKIWGAVKDVGNAIAKKFKEVTTIFNAYSKNENPFSAAIDTVTYLIKSFLGWKDDDRGVIVQSISRFLHSDILKGPSDFFDELGTKFDNFMKEIDARGPFGVLGDMLVGLLGWDKRGNEGLVDVALRKFWDEGLEPTIAGIGEDIVNFGKWFGGLWLDFFKEVGSGHPLDATLHFLNSFLGFERDQSWGDLITNSANAIVKKVTSAFDFIAEKFGELQQWWEEFSLIDTIRDAVLWPLKKFAPGTYKAITETIRFGTEAEGDTRKYDILKDEDRLTDFVKNSSDDEFKAGLANVAEYAAKSKNSVEFTKMIKVLEDNRKELESINDPEIKAKTLERLNGVEELLKSEFNKIDNADTIRKISEQEREELELSAIEKEIAEQQEREAKRDLYRNQKEGKGSGKLNGKHKQMLLGGGDAAKGLAPAIKVYEDTDSIYRMLGKIMGGIAGLESPNTVKESMNNIYKGFEVISSSIMSASELFTSANELFLKENQGKSIIDITRLFFKDFIGFEVDDKTKKNLNTTFSSMMKSIMTNISSIGDNFNKANKWWKSFSLADASKQVILGSVKTVSSNLYESMSKLPEMSSNTTTTLSDDIKKTLEEIKNSVKVGGGAGTSYAKTSTMQELGCGPTVATNAFFGTSYTQNDPRWANKTLVGGGAGIDPFTFARNTVDDSNLADSSTGTKGVTPDYFKDSAVKVGKEVVDINTNEMSSVPAGTRMILGSNQHYENATMLGNGLMSVHDPNYEGEYITSVSDKAREMESSPDLQYAGAVVGGGKGKFYNKYGGGNALKISAQSGRECTTEATKAIYRAYMGKDWDGSGRWINVLTNDLKVSENPFSDTQKKEFENKVSSHFNEHPDYPIYLYQTGGQGRKGNHALNRGEGNHATVIGRKTKDNFYEVYDSAGGKVHKLELGQIFDPTAKGGDAAHGAAQGMKSGEGNMLWIPTIAPTSPITEWMSSEQTSTDNKQSEEKKNEGTGTDTTVTSSSGPITFGDFAQRLAYVAKDFSYQIFQNGKYTGTDWSKYSYNSSDNNTTDTSTTSDTANTSDNMSEKEIWDWFKSKGYNDEATAGIMGRLKQEHNFDPKLSAKKIYYHPGIGELGGHGIFQWTWDTGEGGVDTSLDKDAYFKKGKEQYPTSRLAKYLKWADEKKKPYESSSSELEYFWDKDKEDNKYFAKRIAGIDSWEPKDLNKFNRKDVVYKWTAGYERGQHGANDAKYANEFYDKYAKGGGSGKRSKKKLGGGGSDELRELTVGANRIVSKAEYEKAANAGEGRMSEGPSVPIDKEYESYKKEAEKDRESAKNNIQDLKIAADTIYEKEEPEKVSMSNIISNRKKDKIFGGGAASTTAETDPHKKDDHKLDPEGPKGLPIYRMYDTRWGSHQYDTNTIAYRGCGPTGMAMIATWATGKDDITPDKAADWALEHKHSVPGEGTSHAFPDAYAKEFGFGMKDQKASQEAVDEGLKKGPLLNNQGPGYFTGGGHYIVIAGKRSDGSYIIHDPAGSKNNINPTSKIDDKTLFAAADQIWVPEGATAGSTSKNGGDANNNNTPAPGGKSSSGPLGFVEAIGNIGSAFSNIAQAIVGKALGIKMDAEDPNGSSNGLTNNNQGDKKEGDVSVDSKGSGTIPHIDGPGHGISDMKKSDFKYNEELKKRAKTDAISIHHPGSESNEDFSAARIHEMHLTRREESTGELWAGIGYNLVIRKNGDTEEGRPIDYQGAHTCGSKNNSHVFGLTVTGNHEAYDPSPEQMDSLAKTIAEVCLYYGIPCDRDHVTGHCDWDDNGYHGYGGTGKGCPGVKLYPKIPEAIEKAKKLIEEYNAKKKGGGKGKNSGKVKQLIEKAKATKQDLFKQFDSRFIKNLNSEALGGGDGEYIFGSQYLSNRFRNRKYSYSRPSLLNSNNSYLKIKRKKKKKLMSLAI